MSDERLQRDDDALLGKLLRAGDSDEPSSQTVQKVLLAVTATASATGAASAAGAAGAAGAAKAAATGASGSALLSGGVLKWLGIGVVLGVGTSVGVQAALNAGSKPAPTLAAKTAALPGIAEKAGAALRQSKAAPIEPEQVAAPEPNENPAAEASPANRAPIPKAIANSEAVPGSGAKSGTTPGTLKDELLVLERARGAVARGDSAAANAAISEYRTRFPKGRLYPELTLVRIDLLAQSGRQAQARQLAARFLANNPQSPSAARLKARFDLGK